MGSGARTYQKGHGRKRRFDDPLGKEKSEEERFESFDFLGGGKVKDSRKGT